MTEQTTTLSLSQSRISSTILADISNMAKRKMSHSTSYSEAIATSKRKIDLVSPVKSIEISSTNLENRNFPDTSLTDQEDIFEWMEKTLGNDKNENSILSAATPMSSITKPLMNIDSDCCNHSDDTDLGLFLSIDEYDSCYQEMISLLAEDETKDDSNAFKEVEASFLSDQLLQNCTVPTKPFRSSERISKSSTNKNSFDQLFVSRRSRSSRIGIREGLEKLVNANRLSATSRQMLLSCKLSLPRKKSQ